MKYTTLLLIIVMNTFSLFAQEIPLPGENEASDSPSSVSSLSYGGYLENSFTANIIDSDHQLTNSTKARFNLEGGRRDYYDFSFSLIGTIYSGSSKYNLADSLSDDLKDQISMPELYYYTPENSLELKEAFGSLYFGKIFFRLGRQKYYTGTGYAYNPTDLFNKKNPLDPTYEVEGIDAMRFFALLPLALESDLIFRPGENIDESDYLARLKLYAHAFEAAFLISSVVKKRINYQRLNSVEITAALAAGDSDALNPESYTQKSRWTLYGAELSTEVAAVHLYAEGGYLLVDEISGRDEIRGFSENHERCTLGVDYTFDSQLYIIIEYLRNGSGVANSTEISFNDVYGNMLGETISVSQNTLFAGGSYPIADLSELRLFVISGFEEERYLLNPQLAVDVVENAQLDLNLFYSLLGETSPWADSSGGYVRVRWSF